MCNLDILRKKSPNQCNRVITLLVNMCGVNPQTIISYYLIRKFNDWCLLNFWLRWKAVQVLYQGINVGFRPINIILIDNTNLLLGNYNSQDIIRFIILDRFLRAVHNTDFFMGALLGWSHTGKYVSTEISLSVYAQTSQNPIKKAFILYIWKLLLWSASWEKTS